jgi:hypothetical protein
MIVVSVLLSLPYSPTHRSKAMAVTLTLARDLELLRRGAGNKQNYPRQQCFEKSAPAHHGCWCCFAGRVYRGRWRGLDVAVKVLHHDVSTAASVANEVDLVMSFRWAHTRIGYNKSRVDGGSWAGRRGAWGSRLYNVAAAVGGRVASLGLQPLLEAWGCSRF